MNNAKRDEGQYKRFLVQLKEQVKAEKDRKEGEVVFDEVEETYEHLASDFPHVRTKSIVEFAKYLEKQVKESKLEYVQTFRITRKFIDGLNASISQVVSNFEDQEKKEEGSASTDQIITPNNQTEDYYSLEIRNESISSLFFSVILIPIIQQLSTKQDLSSILEYYEKKELFSDEESHDPTNTGYNFLFTKTLLIN